MNKTCGQPLARCPITGRQSTRSPVDNRAQSRDLRADLGVALQPAVGTESGDLRVYGAAAGAWPCRSISVRSLDRRLLGP